LSIQVSTIVGDWKARERERKKVLVVGEKMERENGCG
jgi:hypothetical protein